VCVRACVCVCVRVCVFIHELYVLLLYMFAKLSAVCLVTELNFYLPRNLKTIQPASQLKSKLMHHLRSLD